MKNSPFLKAVLLLGTALYTHLASAQLLAFNRAEKTDSNLIYTKNLLAAARDTRNHSVRDPLILAHFTKNYTDVSRLQWYIVDNGVLAKFNKDKIAYNVAYDTDGYWKRTIKYYSEAIIPADLKYKIGKRFADFHIIRAWEIATPKTEQSVYLVQAQKGDQVNELRISRGQTTVIRKIKLIGK